MHTKCENKTYGVEFVDEQIRLLEKDYKVWAIPRLKKEEIMKNALIRCGVHATRATVANCVRNSILRFATKKNFFEKHGLPKYGLF